MVGADGLLGDEASGAAVGLVADDGAAAVDAVGFTDEVLAVDVDVEGIGLGTEGPQLATQVLAVDIGDELIGVVGVVAHPVVEVVVGDAGACAEGYLAVVVGEEVDAVVVVVLDDGELGVEHHPVDEVGELAEPAADAL